jgi:hypothetical protein
LNGKSTMGDYLNNVAARVSGTRTAVRPRLPSLFEPSPALASSRLSSLVNLHREGDRLHSVAEEVEVPAPPPSTRPASTPRFHQVREAAQPVPAAEPHDDPASPQSLPAETGSQPIVRRVSEASISAPQLPAEISASSVTHTVAPAASHQTQRSAERPSRPVEAIQTRIADRKEPPRDLPERLSPVPAEPLPLREIHTVERTIPVPAQTSRASTPVISAPLRQSNPPGPAASTTPAFFTDHVENAAPTVQVVIGRVTVQAVAPQPHAAPAPPRQQKPRLSLEDYLKQREARP